MGMYDSVVARCPSCGEKVEFQTKMGPCELRKYKPSSVPVIIAAALDGSVEACACGARVTLRSTLPKNAYMHTELATDEDEDDE